MAVKNLLIITGGNVDIQWTKAWLARRRERGMEFDYCIAADGGLTSADMLGIKVNYLLGDYDSVNAEVLARYRNEVENAVFPREKDYTDTELAVRAALSLLGEDGSVTMIGATGTRLDHTLANIGLLEQFKARGVGCEIVDRHNCVRMLMGTDSVRFHKLTQFGSFVSCISLAGVTRGLTMQGFKYPLAGYDLAQGTSLCISNEITEDNACISIIEGKLLVLETRD